MDLAEQLERDYNEHIERQRDARVFESTKDVIDFLESKSAIPRRVGVNMLLVDKETFHGGWTLWLASKALHPITAAQMDMIRSMDFDMKAKHVFKLSVWEQSWSNTDFESIPLGTEISVERVTRLSLYRHLLAQGNTTRVVPILPRSEFQDARTQSNPESPTDSSDSNADPHATTDSEDHSVPSANSVSVRLTQNHDEETKSDEPLPSAKRNSYVSPQINTDADGENPHRELDCQGQHNNSALSSGPIVGGTEVSKNNRTKPDKNGGSSRNHTLKKSGNCEMMKVNDGTDPD